MTQELLDALVSLPAKVGSSGLAEPRPTSRSPWQLLKLTTCDMMSLSMLPIKTTQRLELGSMTFCIPTRPSSEAQAAEQRSTVRQAIASIAHHPGLHWGGELEIPASAESHAPWHQGQAGAQGEGDNDLPVGEEVYFQSLHTYLADFSPFAGCGCRSLLLDIDSRRTFPGWDVLGRCTMAAIGAALGPRLTRLVLHDCTVGPSFWQSLQACLPCLHHLRVDFYSPRWDPGLVPFISSYSGPPLCVTIMPGFGAGKQLHEALHLPPPLHQAAMDLSIVELQLPLH